MGNPSFYFFQQKGGAATKKSNRIAKHNQTVLRTLAKTGRKSVPKNPKTGEKRTVEITKRIIREKKPVRIGFLGTKVNYCCPKCGYLLEFKKKKHRIECFRCGQILDWSRIENMQAVWIEAKDAEDAGYWAAQYEILCGGAFGLDTDQWRLIRKEYPLLLYFPFPEGKGYGRFMRMAAKDAKVVKEF